MPTVNLEERERRASRRESRHRLGRGTIRERQAKAAGADRLYLAGAWCRGGWPMSLRLFSPPVRAGRSGVGVGGAGSAAALRPVVSRSFGIRSRPYWPKAGPGSESSTNQCSASVRRAGSTRQPDCVSVCIRFDIHREQARQAASPDAAGSRSFGCKRRSFTTRQSCRRGNRPPRSCWSRTATWTAKRTPTSHGAEEQRNTQLRYGLQRRATSSRCSWYVSPFSPKSHGGGHGDQHTQMTQKSARSRRKREVPSMR